MERHYATTVYAMGLCLCLAQVGVLRKWLNVRLHKQHCMIAKGCRFVVPKISAKFDQGHPQLVTKRRLFGLRVSEF